MIGFEHPEWLWLLVPVAVALALGLRRSRRWESRRQRRLSAALRALALTALLLALAGLTYRHESDALGVIFALDASASVDPAERARAIDLVRAALAAQGPSDLSGVVVFGADAQVEVAPRTALALGAIGARPNPHQSGLAGALRLAGALLPGDRTRRIVLLSDGEQTSGDALTQVHALADARTEIFAVPLDTVQGADVILERLLLPALAEEGQAWELRAVLRADRDTTGTLRLTRDDAYLGQHRVALRGGQTEVFAFRQESDQSGLYRYRAVFEPDDADLDRVPQNNEATASIQVAGAPRILYAEGIPGQSEALSRALRAEGFGLTVATPAQIPPDLAGLRGYAAVILSDVPAWELSSLQQAALQSYVRDLGAGLIMIGGDRSFGLGGYYRTPVAEALPVRMDLDDQSPLPVLGMVLAIDKSGSMASDGKLEMAKAAAISTAELMSARDHLGVIGFDGAASWVVPFQNLRDKGPIIETLAALQPGGGTDIYPALEHSFLTLNHSPASLKHVILLSDGITSGGDYQTLITKANQDKITLTALAVGNDADLPTMRDFAQWGGGNYYHITDSSAIPAIFTRETLLATQAFLIEEPIRVRRKAPSELLSGVNVEGLPPLQGMVATSARPRATVLLERDAEQALPILVTGRHGLGRSAAFTSDCKGRWASAWVGTEDYARLWVQLARWVAGGDRTGGLQVQAEARDGVLVVTADALNTSGDFRNFLDGSAQIIGPDQRVHDLPLTQTGPGRYQGSLPLPTDGAWLVSAALREGGEVVAHGVAEAQQPWSPEYAKRGQGRALMEEIGRVGGGGLLASPAEVYVRPKQGQVTPVPLWGWLVPWVALALLAEVATRRFGAGAAAPPSAAAVRSSAAEVATPQQPVQIDEMQEIPKETNEYASRLLRARAKAGLRQDEP